MQLFLSKCPKNPANSIEEEIEHIVCEIEYVVDQVLCCVLTFCYLFVIILLITAFCVAFKKQIACSDHGDKMLVKGFSQRLISSTYLLNK